MGTAACSLLKKGLCTPLLKFNMLSSVPTLLLALTNSTVLHDLYLVLNRVESSQDHLLDLKVTRIHLLVSSIPFSISRAACAEAHAHSDAVDRFSGHGTLTFLSLKK